MDKKGIFLMGVREEENGLTKGQLEKARQKRLTEHYGDISHLPLGEQEAIRNKLSSQELSAPPKSLIDFDQKCFSCGD